MKILLLLILSLLAVTGYSQSVMMRDTTNVDSLTKRIQRLERNQTVIMVGLHKSGAKIGGGAGLLGVGFLASIGGSILLSVVKPTIVNDGGGRYHTKIAPGQIIGIVLGTVGVGLSIGGAFTISSGGKVLKDL